jgi:hypothetical protein
MSVANMCRDCILLKKRKGTNGTYKIRAEECFDKVLNEEFKKKLMCKMKNVITKEEGTWS